MPSVIVKQIRAPESASISPERELTMANQAAQNKNQDPDNKIHRCRFSLHMFRKQVDILQVYVRDMII